MTVSYPKLERNDWKNVKIKTDDKLYIQKNFTGCSSQQRQKLAKIYNVHESTIRRYTDEKYRVEKQKKTQEYLSLKCKIDPEYRKKRVRKVTAYHKERFENEKQMKIWQKLRVQNWHDKKKNKRKKRQYDPEYRKKYYQENKIKEKESARRRNFIFHPKSFRDFWRRFES